MCWVPKIPISKQKFYNYKYYRIFFLNFSSKKYFLKVEDITVLKNIDNEIDGQNVEYNRELSLTGMLMKFVRWKK